MEEQRPDPEQLLRQIKAKTKSRGKLKIFFGACAGSGKTYSMLMAAHEKIKEGEEVVAGIIEAHGRSDTFRLQEGIPFLPLREVVYQGVVLKELDLDAALEQKPHILLVDELAHTNIVGSRHPKRWQDVQELLESGINVYTTLNVQHLETLNDTVANLTGIRVKETIPDSIFENADEIVLVDVPSEVILKRLAEGKVYLGEFTKQRAQQHFFKIENLMALREAALRRTAERVDALRDIYQKFKSGGKKGVISDRILVCIGTNSLSTKLIRTAKQHATRLKSAWTVLYIETERHYQLSEEERLFVEKSLRLAEQLGAKRVILQASSIAKGILGFAEENQFSQIILGKSQHSSFTHRFRSSIVDMLMDSNSRTDIYIVQPDSFNDRPKKSMNWHTPWMSYASALIILSMCTLLGLPLRTWLEPQNPMLIYLAGIVVIAASSERYVAFISAFIAVFCYKFFFIKPYYHYEMYNLSDLVTVSVFFITSLVIGGLTSQLRLQNLFASQREKYSSELYALSRKLMVTPGKSKISKVAAQHIGEAFHGAATIWLPDKYGNVYLASHPDVQEDIKEKSVAQWAFNHKQPAGLNTDTMPSARGYYIPLVTGDLLHGVLGIIPKDPLKIFNIEESMMLEALALQIAMALERVFHADHATTHK